MIEGKRRPSAAALAMPDLGARAVADVDARDEADSGPRFGFTVTKKLGSAVVRNRIRRRLREIVRVHAAANALDGCDYVIVAREGALRCPAGVLRAELILALEKVNAKLRASRR